MGAQGLRWKQEGGRLLLGKGLLRSTLCFIEWYTKPPLPPLPVRGDGGWLSLGPLFGAM